MMNRESKPERDRTFRSKILTIIVLRRIGFSVEKKDEDENEDNIFFLKWMQTQ